MEVTPPLCVAVHSSLLPFSSPEGAGGREVTATRAGYKYSSWIFLRELNETPALQELVRGKCFF